MKTKTEKKRSRKNAIKNVPQASPEIIFYRVWANIQIFYGRKKNILPVAVSTTTVLVSLAKNTRKYNQSKETKK